MNHIRALWLAVVLLAINAAPLLAQIGDKPSQPPRQNPYTPWILAIVGVAIVGVAAFKHSKRSHQD